MRCVVGIDLGSTTTKAVLLDERGEVVGQGITNSRSNYEVACAVAHEEALASARFRSLERALAQGDGDLGRWIAPLEAAFRHALYLAQLGELRAEMRALMTTPLFAAHRERVEPAALAVLDEMEHGASALFDGDSAQRSSFFRDLAGSAFLAGAESRASGGDVPFERLVGLFDRAILNVETRLVPREMGALLRAAADGLDDEVPDAVRALVALRVDEVCARPIEEVAFVGTGYGRQTLPFPPSAIRSEILCHGRGAHRVFPGTRTVLDIGGQDTKAIQVNERGVVTSFQMNDRCAAGCGRYLGYIADELNLGLHELGPLAMRARRVVKVNSTCTVFAGAELRERLALGQRREDVLAGLHRSIMLRAMSLLARSGGIRDEFSFTGGVCHNPMATRVLRELVDDNYGAQITLNTHPDSIYMGALGAAMYALEDAGAGKGGVLPDFVARAAAA